MAALTPSEKAQLDALIVRRRSLIREINDATRVLTKTQREIQTVQDRLRVETDAGAKDLLVQTLTRLQQQEKQQDAALNTLNQALDEVERQIDLLQAPRPGNTAQESAGIAVKDDAAAAQEAARTQNPPTPAQSLGPNEEIVDADSLDRPPSNAVQPPLSNNSNLGLVDGVSSVGGADPVRTTVQTQSSGVTGAAAPDDASTSVATTVGVAAPSAVQGRVPVPREFVDPIDATPNLLGRLASMTYTVSIYLLDDGEYSELLIKNRKVLPVSTSLLIQSGGIAQSDARGTGLRNAFFDVDFYIDDLQINNLVAGPALGGAHTATTLDFTLTEPYGITLLPRLKAAVIDKNGDNRTINELSQNFLMVVRFFGYNEQGILLNGSKLGVRETGSDTNSIVEKWIPFNITDITYKIASKVTEYRVKAVVTDSNVAFSSMTATIPFNFELTSDTVQDLLNGQTALVSAGAPQADPNQSEAETRRLEATAPPKATAIPAKKTYVGGLCDALNQHEQNLVRINGFSIANRFVIELEDVAGMRDAKVARPGRDDKKTSAMNKNQDAAAKYLSSRTNYKPDQKNFGIVAGTQIVQVIDLVMRTSSYITSQQTIIFDPKTGDPTNQSPVTTVQWYRIRSECRPLGYDRKRRNIAYEIKYVISRYQINDPRSAYYPNARYRGAHKIYNYWFTGLNSEVLDFQIDVNSNFFMTIGNDGKSVEPSPNAQFIEKRAFQARPGQSTQPGSNEAGMPAANLADRIYSPIDVAEIKLEILGDPDWIQQSEVFYKGIDLRPFVQDGSVNYDASEVLFEINFNPVTDYDLSTGLMDSLRQNTNPGGAFSARPQKDVFRTTEVHSFFRQGRFTQQLKGLVCTFDELNRSAVPTNNNVGSSGAVASSGTRTPTAAVPDFEIQSGNNGLLDLELGTADTGAINYKPVGLARVLDRQRALDRAISTPAPKPGTTVVSDDAVSESPFAGGA